MAQTIEDLQRIRRAIDVKVNTLKIAVSRFSASTSVTVVDKRLKELDDLRTKLNAAMEGVNVLCTSDSAYSTAIKEFAVTEQLIIDVDEAAGNFKKTIQPASPTHATSKVQEVRLPKLDLPSFSGDRMDWPGYHDLFVASVHNNAQLTGAQKLQYLKRSLVGEPATMVNPYECTDSNYDKAWKMLAERYQHLRDLAYAITAKFMNHPVLRDSDSKSLRRLVDVCRETIIRLQTLQVRVDRADFLTTYILLQKLDVETRRQWQLSLKDDRMPSFEAMVDYLESRAKALEEVPGQRIIKPAVSSQQPTASSGKPYSATVKTAHATTGSPSKLSCYACKKNHYLYQCPTFIDMDLEQKKLICKNRELCTNCFSHRHPLEDCPSRMSCGKCREKHNELLCESDFVVGHLGIKRSVRVLLGTAAIQIKDINGRIQTFRALLDTGSQASFISGHAAKLLGLPRQSESLSISGLSTTKCATSNGSVFMQLCSSIDKEFKCDVQAYILKKVTCDLPAESFPAGNYPQFKGLYLADPGYNVKGPINVLLGMDVLPFVMMNGLKTSNEGLMAQRTVWGWVLSGTIPETPKNVTHHVISGHTLVHSSGGPSTHRRKKMRRFPLPNQSHYFQAHTRRQQN